jgi:hypothetical protein
MIRAVRSALAALAAAAALALAAGDAGAQSSTFEQVYGDGTAYMDLRESMLLESEDFPGRAGLLASVAKARAAMEKSLERPSTLKFAKAGGKIDRTLRRAWVSEEAMSGWLNGFAQDHLLVLGREWAEVRDAVDLLPEGPSREALATAVEALGAAIDEVPWDGSPASFAPLYRALARFAARTAALDRKLAKAILAVTGKNRMGATMEGGSFEAETIQGWMLVGSEGGPPVRFSLNGLHVHFDWGGEASDDARIVLDVRGGPSLSPGVFTVESEAVSGYIDRNVAGLVSTHQLATGTVTVLRVDAATGEVAGTFAVSGALGEDTVTAEGRFHWKGLPVSVAE